MGRSDGRGGPSDATLVWMRCRAVVLAALLALAGVVVQTALAEGAGQSTATRVTIFGDSAATAMAYDPEAKRILGRGIDLKLEVAACRRLATLSCPYDGVRPPSVVERAAALGRELGPVVVVFVGYNDYENTYRENIEEALTVFRTSRRQAGPVGHASRGALELGPDEPRHRAGGQEPSRDARARLERSGRRAAGVAAA